MPLHRISPEDHCRLVAKAGKTRNQSTKFLCGECNLECKMVHYIVSNVALGFMQITVLALQQTC